MALRALAVGLLVALTGLVPVVDADAQEGPAIGVVVTTTDGVAPFDETDGPGFDTGPSNLVVRTNDRVRYDLEISLNADVETDASFVATLPRGLVVSSVPPYCEDGSSLVPATIGDPVTPVTETTWLDLPAQQLTCVVGTRAASSTVSYPISAIVRPEVPNGSTLDAADFVVSLDGATVAEASADPMVVSAGPRYNLSANSTAVRPDSGYYARQGWLDCVDGSGRTCYQFVLPLLVGAEGDGVGAAPLDGGFSFVDDLSLTATYGTDVVDDPEFVAAGAAAAERYGAILVSCRRLNWRQPESSLDRGDAETAVRDSGTTSCTQPDGPGTPVEVQVDGVDSTLHTRPTRVARPSQTPIETGLGYIYSHAITVQIPLDAVLDLGTPAADGTGGTLRWTHGLTAFTATALDGTANADDAQDPSDDVRTITATANARGSFDLWFVGVPGARENVPPSLFNQGWPIYEGPAAGTGIQTGDGQVMAGQPVQSIMNFRADAAALDASVSFVGCQAWQAGDLWLREADIAASETARAQAIGSGGAAVWLTGRNTDRRWLTAAGGAGEDVPTPELTVEYGTGRADGACGDADSPDGWFADPALVPGNDPALVPAGLYTGVTKVRVHTTLPPETTGVGNWAWVAVSLQAAPDLEVGDRISIRGSFKRVFSEASLAEVLADETTRWTTSRYDVATNQGRLGDRLTIGGATVQVDSVARVGSDAPWADAIVASGGQLVDVRLTPVLGAIADFEASQPVVVEHCLAAGLGYLSSSVDPQVVRDGAPADAELVCPLGRTYVRWDLGDHLVNAAITPVDLAARVSSLAPDGSRVATTAVASPIDASPLARRTDELTVDLVQPAGIELDVTTLTPMSEPNPAGETTPSPLRWRIELGRSGAADVDTVGEAEAVDLIALLPSDRIAGSVFAGTLTALDADLSDAGLELWASANDPATIDLDPEAASNLANGTTEWCRVGTDGCGLDGIDNGGIGNGGIGNAGALPTALRVRGEHRFGDGPVTLDVSVVPIDNGGGDFYSLAVAGRADRLDLPVGPSRAVARVVASSVSFDVFADLDGDGSRADDEPGVAGHPVRLDGVDGDGNIVARATTTDATGRVAFDGLSSGDYTVTAGEPPAGQVFTHLDLGDDAADSDVDPLDGTVGVALPSNTTIDGLAAGLAVPASVAGVVVDGLGEPLAGVELTLTGTADTGTVTPRTTTSDAAGRWSFDELRAGTYVVVETQPVGHGQGVNDPGGVGTALDVDRIEFVLGPGVDADGVVFAETYASVAGEVRFVADLDAFDPDDPDAATSDGPPEPIAGVVVTLVGTDAAGRPVNRTAVTDAAGRFAFDRLLAGTYDLVESQPPAYLDGPVTTGPLPGSPGVDRVSGIPLAAGARLDGYRFVETGSLVGGVVWLDDDLDGTIGDDEHGRIAGVTILLTDGDGNEIARTETDADGSYGFHGVIPGRYTLVETQPTGHGSTTANMIDIDVEASGATGLGFGEHLAVIDGSAWDDRNGDGIQVGSEPVWPGLDLVLLDADGEVVATATTDAEGRYRFSGLPAGRFRVEPVVDAGTTFTQPTAGPLRDADSDIDWSLGLSAVLDTSSEGCVGGFGGACPPPLIDHHDVGIGLVAAETDLSVALATDVTTTREGRHHEWSVLVANVGSTPQRRVTLIQSIPTGLRFLEAAGEGWSCSLVGQQLNCSYDRSLAPGASAAPLVVSSVVTADEGSLDLEATVAPGVRGVVEIAPADNVVVAGLVVQRPAAALALTGSSGSLLGLGLLLLVVGFGLRGVAGFTPARRP